MQLQARIKPHNPALGHVLRGITIESIGMAFHEGKVYDVDDATATVLRTVRQKHFDPSSQPAFDVMTTIEMKKTLASEAKAKLGITPEMAEALREDLDAEPAPAAPTRPTRRRGAGQ